MTTQKHLKARVRARMAKTGERYASARAHVAGGDANAGALAVAATSDVNGIRHFPGIHPEATVLRILATHAGVLDAHGALPGEEAMLAVGGGLGAGVFAFHYEKEGFSSLYLAGRYRWEDRLKFIEGAARRLGLEPTIRETGSARRAERDLRDALAVGGPVAAWVDWVELGSRGRPVEGSGGAYHVLAVYAIEGDTAIVGDLAERPIAVPLDILARARARIAKQRNRLLTVAPAPGAGNDDLEAAARAGLRQGAESLAVESRRNFSLRAFADLADRMTATSGATSWARIFPRGRRLWTGLSSLHRFVETYFTGGGLLRPMAARAAAQLPGLDEAAARYATLGERWSDLARAALPDAVPLLAETRRIQEGAGGDWENRWARLADLGAEATVDFPLSDAETADVLSDLAARLRTIHAEEVAVLESVRAATA